MAVLYTESFRFWEDRKMKKFILNLLTVFAWIYQIFCVIGIIMGIVMIGVMPFGLKNPDFRRYARLIVKNIKQEVYFADSNLNLLKKLLISVAGYTIISIVDFIMLMTHRAWFIKNANNVLYPSGVTTGLLFLAVLYVVYLVFKYGMKVQEDADSII